MRKSLFICFLFVFLVFPSLISASPNNSTRSAVRSKIEAKIEAREEKLLQIREAKQIKTASREAKLNSLKQNLVKKYYNNMSKRLWATIERLEKLITRIDARIAIVDAETDKDLTKINADVASAKTLLTDTKTLLTSSDNMIDTVIASNNPLEAFKILKENISDIKLNLKEIHRLLVKVIGDIQGLRVGTTKLTPGISPTAIPTQT